MEDWSRRAKKALQNYKYLRVGLENYALDIKELEAKLYGIRVAAADCTPVVGSGNKYEDSLLNCIDKLDAMNAKYEEYKAALEKIQRGLDALNETDALVLQRFYLDDISYSEAVDRLRGELGYEERQIDRFRHRALVRFSLARFLGDG